MATLREAAPLLRRRGIRNDRAIRATSDEPLFARARSLATSASRWRRECVPSRKVLAAELRDASAMTHEGLEQTPLRRLVRTTRRALDSGRFADRPPAAPTAGIE